MSKQIQVNLAFNADTTKAKQQINDLVDSLNKISTKDSQIFDDKQLRDAAKAAQDLTKHLTASVNVDVNKTIEQIKNLDHSFLSEVMNKLG